MDGDREVEEFMAAYLVSGQKQVLVRYEGHLVQSWRPCDGLNIPLTCAHLKTDEDDLSYQPEVAPSSYSCFGGDLRPLICCTTCFRAKDMRSVLNERIYEDASYYGNVSEEHSDVRNVLTPCVIGIRR